MQNNASSGLSKDMEENAYFHEKNPNFFLLPHYFTLQQSNVNFKQQFKDEASLHAIYLNESCLNIFSMFSRIAVFSFKESGNLKVPVTHKAITWHEELLAHALWQC